MFMESSPAADPDVDALREELLNTVATAIDRAVELGRRKGAEAALATVNDAVRQLIGAGAARSEGRGLAGTSEAVPKTSREHFSSAHAIKPQRAPGGAVQEAVMDVLRHSPGPLAPLRIVDAGKAMGHDLKPSSVRMALKALCRDGRAGQDARGDYHLPPRSAVAGTGAPGVNPNDTEERRQDG